VYSIKNSKLISKSPCQGLYDKKRFNFKIKKMKLTFLTTKELITIEGGSGTGEPQTINILSNVIYTGTPPLNP
jgi:hypothetical protein